MLWTSKSPSRTVSFHTGYEITVCISKGHSFRGYLLQLVLPLVISDCKELGVGDGVLQNGRFSKKKGEEKKKQTKNPKHTTKNPKPKENPGGSLISVPARVWICSSAAPGRLCSNMHGELQPEINAVKTPIPTC